MIVCFIGGLGLSIGSSDFDEFSATQFAAAREFVCEFLGVGYDDEDRVLFFWDF